MNKRIPIFLCLVFVINWGLSKGVLQLYDDLIINESFEEVSLEQVFKKMHKKYRIFFSYTREIVAAHKVSVVIDKQPLEEAMDLILAETDLSYEILQGKFVLIKKKVVAIEKAPFICGWIIDKKSGDHLPYATLRLRGTPFGTVCKKDGSFYLQGNYPKDSIVEISYLGFEKRLVPFGQLTSRPCEPIQLERAETSIEAITISEYLTDGISQQGQAIKLQPKKIRTLPGLTETDLFQLTQYIPGISSSEGSASGIQVRGGNTDQTLVTLDGIPLFKLGHFFDMISALNPSGIAEAQIFRSGYDATESGRVSGLIQLSQGEKIPEKVERGLSLNLTHAGFFFKSPMNKGKTGIFLSGRSSIVDHINSPTFRGLEQRVFQSTRIGEQIDAAEEEEDPDFFFENTFNFSDFNGKLLHKAGKKNTFSLIHHFSRNEITYLSELPSEELGAWDSVFQRNFGLGIHWDYDDGKKLKVHTGLTLSDYQSYYNFELYRPEDSLDFTSIEVQNSLVDLRLTHEYIWKKNERTEWKLGGQAAIQEVRYRMAYDHLDFEEPDVEQFTQPSILASVFAYRRHTRDRWWLETSFRTTIHTFTNDLYFDPRVSFDYLITPHLHLKAHSGIYHQFVNQIIQWDFTEEFINQQIWVIADGGTVPAITGFQSSIGLKYDKKGWLVDIEAYRKRNTGLTARNTSFVSAEEEYFINGDSYITGLDVLVKKRWRKFRTWASYTLSSNNYEFDEFLDERFPSPIDQRHRLTLTGLLDLDPVHISLSWNFRTGRPYTDVIGRTDSLIEEPDNNFWVSIPQYGPPMEERLAPYHRVDLSLFYEWVSKKHSNRKISMGLSILNIFNRENQLSRQFFRDYWDEDVPEDERGLYLVDKVMLSRIPNFSVKFTW
ncbi:MAG: TonB-dependent receptor plug domain-containing protein [Bacteroidia bacterium]|nr:TonB-dependent receptor plug domain-containing protein [Bacteroidia bacterium]